MQISADLCTCTSTVVVPAVAGGEQADADPLLSRTRRPDGRVPHRAALLADDLLAARLPYAHVQELRWPRALQLPRRKLLS